MKEDYFLYLSVMLDQRCEHTHFQALVVCCRFQHDLLHVGLNRMTNNLSIPALLLIFVFRKLCLIYDFASTNGCECFSKFDKFTLEGL